MKIHNVTQGTPEWLALRAGIPTASCFDQIITPKGKASTSAERYMHTLLAERMMGHATIEFVSTWMGRGMALEAEAVAYYEGIRELDTERVGFVTNDAGTIGASPDRFVGEDGLLEIKVPKEHVHVGYLLTESVDAAYYPQVQGQLWVSGRAWLDIMSYHPEMPPALIHVARDEEYIAKMATAVESFAVELERRTLECRERGWLRGPQHEARRQVYDHGPARGRDVIGWGPDGGEEAAGGVEDNRVLVQELAKWILDRPRSTDHACSRCIPGGEIVVPGFVCAWHIAEGL